MDPHRGFFIAKSKQHACQAVLVHRYPPPPPPSVEDPGCLSRIPDSDPGSALKNLSILTQ